MNIGSRIAYWLPPVSMHPRTATQFDEAITLIVNGSDFVSGASLITVNSVARVTTFVHSTQLRCTLPAAGAANTIFDVPGTYAVSVGGGGTFTAQNITVNRFAAAELWLRADLGITLSSGKVSAWADQSGIGDTNRNASQATAGKQPTYNAIDSNFNNQSTMTWPATTGVLAGVGNWVNPPSQPLTVYCVAKITTGVDSYIIDTDTTPTYGVLARGTGTVWRAFRGAGANSITLTSAGAAVLCTVFNTTSSGLYVNTYTTPEATPLGGTFPNASWSAHTIGAKGTLATFNNGTIAEILIFSSAHDATQRLRVMSYLGNRYAITVTA